MSSKNSNTFRERRIGLRCLYAWIWAVLVVVCFVNTADALDANEAISQYLHDQWGAELVLGDVESKMGQPAAAEATYRQVLRWRPGNPGALLGLAT